MAEQFEITENVPLKTRRRVKNIETTQNAVPTEPATAPILFEDPVAEPASLSEEELERLQSFKRKLRAYKQSFPDKFKELKWDVLDTDNIDQIEELYNEVQLELNNTYSADTGMLGGAYYSAVYGMEWLSSFTNDTIILKGLTAATSQNQQITNLLKQINIEYGNYDSVMSPEFRLAFATVAAAVQINNVNHMIRANPEAFKPASTENPEKVQNLAQEYPDL